jgi:hypothetical protein
MRSESVRQTAANFRTTKKFQCLRSLFDGRNNFAASDAFHLQLAHVRQISGAKTQLRPEPGSCCFVAAGNTQKHADYFGTDPVQVVAGHFVYADLANF